MKGRGRRRRNQAFARPRSSQEEPWPGTGGRGGASGEEPAASGGGSAPSSSGPPSSGSPPFGGRRGSAGGGYSELDLIVLRAVSEGRELTGVEERHVREGVAAVGFTPGGTQKVTATLAGVEDEGRVLRRGEDHSTDRVHSLKHAKVGREWPEGTTHEEYIRSLSEVILDRRSGMLFSEFKDKGRQLAFVRRSGELRGPGGADWVFVEYRLETGHWMTGLQRPDGPEEIERDPERSNVQWLRRPTL